MLVMGSHMNQKLIAALGGGAVGFGAGFATHMLMTPTLSLPSDVALGLNRLTIEDTVVGMMPFKTVFHYTKTGDWDEWIIGYGFSTGESQVIARVGRNTLTGEISLGIAKYGSNPVNVSVDGVLKGTLVQYTGVDTPFAGFIGIELVAPT